MLFFVVNPLGLFVMIFVLLPFISIPNAQTALSRVPIRHPNSSSVPASPSMSSANRRLVMFLPPILTVPLWSLSASSIIRSRKMLNSVGERRHPCRTPTVVWNHSPTFLLWKTALVALLYSDLMMLMMCSSMLYSFIVAHRALCQTRSNAFLKSMKTW